MIGPIAVGGLTTATAGWPVLQALDFLDVSTPVKIAGAAVLVAVLGAVILWRNEAVVERSIDDSLDRPLVSFIYGVGAHFLLAFAGLYLGNLAGQAGLPGASSGRLGLVVGLLISGSLGFLVVGATVVGFLGEQHYWSGLVVGALLAAVSVAIPSLIGAFVWVVLVSLGIGGVVRTWTHASFAPEV